MDDMNVDSGMPAMDQIAAEQVSIYAKELNDYFRKERDLRSSLRERDELLEHRAREVSALNLLLQQHLMEWYGVARQYRNVLGRLRESLAGGGKAPGGLAGMIDDALGMEDPSTLPSPLLDQRKAS